MATTTAPRLRPAPAPAPTDGAELTVVRDSSPRSATVGLLGVFMFVLTFGALLAMVIFQTLLIQGQFDLDRINTSIGEQQTRMGELRLEVAQLESPDRILAAAQSRFGMVLPAELLPLDPIDPGSAADRLAPPGADPFGFTELDQLLTTGASES